MLILSRRSRESIVIGDIALVTIDRVRGHQYIVSVRSNLKRLDHQPMQKGDSIQIGDDITIVLASIKRKPGSVTLYIEAPKSIPVDRMELWCRKQAERSAKLADSA